MKEWVTPPWTLLLAFVAVGDVLYCLSSMQELPAWQRLLMLGSNLSQRNATELRTAGNPQSPRRIWENFMAFVDQHQPSNTKEIENEPMCPASTANLPFISFLTPMRLRILFTILCLIEGVRRAFLARQFAMETAALAHVEEKLARLVRSAQRLSRPRLHQMDYESSVHDPLEDTMRHVLRIWMPFLWTILLWCLLVPWPWLFADYCPTYLVNEYESCPDDPSVASIWIARASQSVIVTVKDLHEAFVTLAWKLALPFSFRQPLALWNRLRVLARASRYLRYAGPLLRLGLKLQDQLWVFSKIWRQSCAAQLHKAQRVAHRSLLWADVKRVESLAKVKTTLASLPSQLLVNTEVGHAILMTQKAQAAKLKQRLQWLKRKLMFPSTRHLTSLDIYDRLMELTQEVSTEIKSAFWNAHLISPQTRFSVAWRIIVTCTLLSELFRLYWSFDFSGTFDMNYADMTRRLLGLCEAKSRPLRNWIGKLLKLPYNHPWLDTCRQSSPSSQLSLRLAEWSEIGIAAVSFLDIFVWFNTGELSETGLVVPKPFFTRCILPGTLTQVLDHPTVPQAIPRFIASLWTLAGTIGYGRVIRWILALSPAIDMFVVTPLQTYLFRPMDSIEYMTYSESLGLMRTFSTTNAAPLLHQKPSYQSFPIQSPPTVLSFPDQTDFQDMSMSMRSMAEDNEGYGLFY